MTNPARFAAEERTGRPVTLNGGSAYTWVPNPLDAVAIDQWYGESCRPEALGAPFPPLSPAGPA